MFHHLIEMLQLILSGLFFFYSKKSVIEFSHLHPSRLWLSFWSWENKKKKSKAQWLSESMLFVNGRWEVRDIKWTDIKKPRRNGNFWGVVFTDVIPLSFFFSFFPQNFRAAVSVPRWERSSGCQRLKLHREGREGGGADSRKEREGEKGGKGRQKINIKKGCFFF